MSLSWVIIAVRVLCLSGLISVIFLLFGNKAKLSVRSPEKRISRNVSTMTSTSQDDEQATSRVAGSIQIFFSYAQMNFNEQLKTEQWWKLLDFVNRMNGLGFSVNIKMNATMADLRAALRDASSPTIIMWESHVTSDVRYLRDSDGKPIPYAELQRANQNIKQILFFSIDDFSDQINFGDKQTIDARNEKIGTLLSSSYSISEKIRVKFSWTKVDYEMSFPKYLMQFFDPFEGIEVILNGKNLSCFREMIGYTVQNSKFFKRIYGNQYSDKIECLSAIFHSREGLICVPSFVQKTYDLISLEQNKPIPGGSYGTWKQCLHAIARARNSRVCRTIQGRTVLVSTISNDIVLEDMGGESCIDLLHREAGLREGF